jgi:hypothetical protein
MRRKSLTAAICALIVSTALLLPSCGAAFEGVLNGIGKLGSEKPSSENTITDAMTFTSEIAQAVEAGKDNITLNIVATEDDLKNMSEHIDPFWGTPVSYLVTDEWDGISLTETGPAIDVKTVSFNLEQSVSYYAYHAYKNTSGGADVDADALTAGDASGSASASALEPPEGKAENVDALTKALPDIIGEITESTASASPEGGSKDAVYASALAVHDWLVGNIEYDSAMYEGSKDNSVTGALIGRKTMCQGYAEAFELLMRCISDADVRMVVGNGRNEDSSEWVDHAWNIVNISGTWYQVDTTFDDPVNSDRKSASHVYFGRSDAGMERDHTWNADYWPAASGKDFLYYRNAKLYAKSKSKLRSVVTGLLKKGEPKEIEIAVEDAKLNESDLQFIYGSHSKVKGIMYSFSGEGDVTIVNLQLEY